MRNLILWLFLMVLALPACREDAVLAEQPVVRYSIFLNECHGYCKRTLVVDYPLLIWEKTGYNPAVYPPVREQMQMDPESWERLSGMINNQRQYLDQLQPTIGCPYCPDKIGQELTLFAGQEEVSLAVELAMAPARLVPLLEELRQLEQQFE